MTERERAKAIEAMRQADRDHHAIRTRTGDGRGIMPIYCKCDAGFVSKEELSRHVNEQRLRALLDGGYVVLTDKEPLIAWSETKPGVGMVRLAGRTLVVMEQDTFRAFSESPKEPR